MPQRCGCTRYRTGELIEIEHSIAKINESKYFKAWLNKVILSKSTKLFRKNKDVNLSEDESHDEISAYFSNCESS